MTEKEIFYRVLGICLVDTGENFFIHNNYIDNSSVASLTIKSRYANILVFIDCENNQFLKK